MKIVIEESWDDVNKCPITNYTSDMNEEGVRETIDLYLRGQVGKGEDNRTPNKVDKYVIELTLDTSDDSISVKSNTGNSALTCGIVMEFFNKFFPVS